MRWSLPRYNTVHRLLTKSGLCRRLFSGAPAPGSVRGGRNVITRGVARRNNGKRLFETPMTPPFVTQIAPDRVPQAPVCGQSRVSPCRADALPGSPAASAPTILPSNARGPA